MVTLPTKKTTTTTNERLYRYEQDYLPPILRNTVVRGVKLRILVDKSAYDGINKGLLIANSPDIVEIQILDGQQQNKIITALVDKEVCLSVEVRDNDGDYEEYDSAIEVLGLATYSNNDSTVLSYASIFETLWIEAELREVSGIT